jgi:hypothetical protein
MNKLAQANGWPKGQWAYGERDAVLSDTNCRPACLPAVFVISGHGERHVVRYGLVVCFVSVITL